MTEKHFLFLNCISVLIMKPLSGLPNQIISHPEKPLARTCTHLLRGNSYLLPNKHVQSPVAKDAKIHHLTQ